MKRTEWWLNSKGSGTTILREVLPCDYSAKHLYCSGLFFLLMRHPVNKLQRRAIEQLRSAGRGVSRLSSPQGSLPVPLRPRVFRSSKKTTLHGLKRKTQPAVASNQMPDFRLIDRLEKIRATHEVAFNRLLELVAALAREQQKLTGFKWFGEIHQVEALNTRKKIPYKGKKWEYMKNLARKQRARTILTKYSKEIRADPRLAVNRNATGAILSYERIKIGSRSLMDALLEKFEMEGNAEAVNALRQGHKLIFIKESGKWADSVKEKARNMLEAQRRRQGYVEERIDEEEF